MQWATDFRSSSLPVLLLRNSVMKNALSIFGVGDVPLGLYLANSRCNTW